MSIVNLEINAKEMDSYYSGVLKHNYESYKQSCDNVSDKYLKEKERLQGLADNQNEIKLDVSKKLYQIKKANLLKQSIPQYMRQKDEQNDNADIEYLDRQIRDVKIIEPESYNQIGLVEESQMTESRQLSKQQLLREPLTMQEPQRNTKRTRLYFKILEVSAVLSMLIMLVTALFH